jgi:hypothetical protein
MKKRVKKQISLFLSAIAIIQILLLINANVAESYLVSKTEEVIEKAQVTAKKNDEARSLIDKGVNFLIGFLSIKQIGVVSAQNIQEWCCPEMKPVGTQNGARCVPLSSERASECIDPIPTKCENTPVCDTGCCIQPTGQCSLNSPKGNCTAGGGVWKEDETCSIQECSLGCCTATHELTTRKQCEDLSRQENVALNFLDSVTDEPTCIGLQFSGMQGACVFEDQSCQRIPNEGISDALECVNQGGKFSQGKLCSHPLLNTTCTRTNYTGCDPAVVLPEIYWFDSCGNRENIYNANKATSWNNGNILSKDSSCGAGTGSINSHTCGNCDSFLNSICSPSTGSNKINDGNFICKDLRCHYKDQWNHNVTKDNGESWCVYDGSIGSVKSPWSHGLNFSSDVVGSRHWKWSCVDGEIIKEGCMDGRTEICAESRVDVGGGNKFSVAQCIVNEGKMCLDLNPLQYVEDDKLIDNTTLIQACNDNKFCAIKKVDVDKYFKFDLCMPRYPVASNLSDGVDDAVCKMWEFKCTIVEGKKFLGSWDCKENCGCKTEKFVQQLNDVCASWSDCGSKVNIVGKGTDNYVVEGKNQFGMVSECTSSGICGQECRRSAHCFNYTGSLAKGNDIAGFGNDIIGTNPGEHVINKTQGVWSCQNVTEWSQIQNRYVTQHLNCQGNNPLELAPAEVEYLIQECKTVGTCNGNNFQMKPQIKSKFSWQNYTKYARPVNGQYAEVPNYDEYMATILGGGEIPAVGTPAYGEFQEKTVDYLSGIPGAIGSTISLLTLTTGASMWASVTWSARYAATKVGAAAPTAHFTTLGTIAVAAAAFAIGTWVGGKIAQSLGYTGTWGTLLALSFGAAFAGLAILLVPGIANSWNPVGWVLLIVAFIGSVLTFLFGTRHREREATFTCMPWEAPYGGDDCSKCNDNPDKPCTRYRCESLGQACVYVGDNMENAPCDAIEDDGKPPVITPLKIDSGYKFVNTTANSTKVRRTNNACLPTFTEVDVTFKTDEYARCNWTAETTWPGVDMPSPYPIEGNGFIFNHTFRIKMPSIDMLNANDVSGDIRKWFGNMNFNIACTDFYGRTSYPKYKVNFCIEEEDKTPVNHAFTIFVPRTDTKLKIGTTSVPIKMLINKPAECKYDTKPGTDYSSMPYTMDCKTGLGDLDYALGGSGWPCTTNMTGLVTGDNRIYVRCKAQPYFPASRQNERRTNGQDKEYNLIVTDSQLVIDDVSFTADDMTIGAGGKFVLGGANCLSVNMQVRTSEGADNGIATCKWGITKTGSRWDFPPDDGVTHNQVLNPRCVGTHVNYIDCFDGAGNTASVVANFTLEIDTQPPRIINNETIDGNMRLETDELANCYYNNYACRTNPANQTPITQENFESFETEHWIYDLSPRRDYYVTCKDVYNHTNPSCAIIIKATEVDDGTPPIATRVYNDAGNLKLITNEAAKCSYSTANCNFNISNGIWLDTAGDQEWSTEHFTEWNPKQTYHIKCRDDWGNTNQPECLIIVKPEELYDD